MNIKINTKKLNITEVSVGDYIKSFNIDSNNIEYNEILHLHNPIVEIERQIKLIFDNGQSIITSKTHPMCYLNDTKWEYKETGLLNVGDICKFEEGSGVITNILTNEEVNNDINFFDLTVNNVNNYFSGSNIDNLVLTHNSSTVHFPYWHKDIEDILVLKNNKGTDDNRVRHMDYSIQMNRLIYRRIVKNEMISLFSPHDVPDLYDAFFKSNELFESLYEKYENDSKINKKQIKATDLINLLAQERIGTGRIYIMNIDHVNDHSSFLDPVKMSNLCQEITLPTTPLNHIEDDDSTDAEIALCVLAAINLGAIKELSEFEKIMDISVRVLDFIIENQDYPVKAALKMLKRRSLGIGITNFAYWLAKNNVNYDSKDALPLVDELMEHMQYYGIKASVNLAKEYGSAEFFNRTKYSKGILPIDTYNKNVDTIVNRKHTLDWEKLRKEVLEYGMRNSTISALMPCESCVTKDSKIITSNGVMSYDEILKSKNISIDEIESIGEQKWIEFDTPLQVQTMNGIQESNRVFYNGLKEVYEIEFEDGNKYKMTANHKLLVNRDGNQIWVRADELEIDDDIVNIIQ
jgi:ribonucleoside-diphosphate reductase alpha subunit